MDILKFASIDIGSNAVRLLISNVIPKEDPVFKKASLTRIPLRLGQDSFALGRISKKKEELLIKTMHAFRYLIEVQDIIAYRGFATSAMREAENGTAIAERIRNECHIDLEVIDGNSEAKIIYGTHIEKTLEPDKNYLYVDVGGGSTEITLFNKGIIGVSHSFNIGTVRILNDQVSEDDWLLMEEWIRQNTKNLENLALIGSGGNINKIYKMSKYKDKRPISYKKVREIYNEVKKYDYSQRISELSMKPDRADVIIPATDIFLDIMKWSGANEIHVPKIGLVDGMARLLYQEHIQKLALNNPS